MCKGSWREICGEWRLWIRPFLILVYVLFAIIIIPLLIVNSVKDGFTRKDQLILIGGLFVLAAVPISVWHITQHIIHFTKPILQKHIVRILWMVPIYALNATQQTYHRHLTMNVYVTKFYQSGHYVTKATLGLLFPQHSIYVDSLRECYEAYVIYNFMVYLLNYLNLGMDLEMSLEHKPQVKHIFPLCCMRPWEMGREFIHNCKHGILQYTVVRPITTFVSVICELCGVYGEGTFKANVAFPYIIFVNNVSQFVAMYCLVLFYQANKMDLKPMRPIPKFLCIKAVVFFSFFQGVLINFLVYYGYIKDIFGAGDENADPKGLASELQNFLICIEMFLAALAHIYSFPHEPFHINLPHYPQHRNWWEALLAMLDISDVQEDVSEHIGVVGSSLSRRFRGRTSYQVPRGGSSSETQYLIPQMTGSQCYQSGVDSGHVTAISNTSSTTGAGPSNNKYGAFDTSRQQPQTSNQAITINNKKDAKEYSPHHGAPTSSNFLQNRSMNGAGDSSISMKNDLTTNTSSKSESISTHTGAIASGSASASATQSNIKKSDSSASDWLSTPTDEMMGIDVKGVEKDRITFFTDPRA